MRVRNAEETEARGRKRQRDNFLARKEARCSHSTCVYLCFCLGSLVVLELHVHAL